MIPSFLVIEELSNTVYYEYIFYEGVYDNLEYKFIGISFIVEEGELKHCTNIAYYFYNENDMRYQDDICNDKEMFEYFMNLFYDKKDDEKFVNNVLILKELPLLMDDTFSDYLKKEIRVQKINNIL